MDGLTDMSAARNYRMSMAYDGTDYAGFQIQRDGRTVQGALEEALSRITQRAVRVTAAGRTDAGVHAAAQVVSFRSEWRHSEAELERALNAVLPDDIAVRQVERVAETFHARFSASSREYLYRIYRAPVRVPYIDRYAWQVNKELQGERLTRATRMLVREADFRAFGQAADGRSTVRRIVHAEWSVAPVAYADVPGWDFYIEANGFLRGMVRRIVGTLVQVGLGVLEPEIVEEILLSADPARAAAPAPARGLFFWRAWYPGDRRDAETSR